MVLPFGIDTGKHHRNGDTGCAMARDVAAIIAKAFFCLRNGCGFVVEGVWTRSHVFVLRATGGIASGILFHSGDELVDFGGVLFGERHAESFGEDFQEVIRTGVGILDGLLAAFGLSECLAILVHVEVLFEQKGTEFWWRADEGGVERGFFFRQVVVRLSVSNDSCEQ